MYITRLANEAGVLGFPLGGLESIMLGLGTFTRHLYRVRSERRQAHESGVSHTTGCVSNARPIVP